MPKSINTLICCFMILLNFICFTGSARGDEEAANLSPDSKYLELYEKAAVLEVNKVKEDKNSAFKDSIVEQEVKVRVLSGIYKGKILTAQNTLSGTEGYDIELQAGDEVVLYITVEEQLDGKKSIQNVYVADRVRSHALGWLVLLFVGLIIIIGRVQGIKALMGLGVTILGIYKVLLPGLMKGQSPLPLTILVLIGVTLLTMILVAGFTQKSLAATLGTLGGLLVAGFLAYAFGDLAQLSGLATEEDRMLLYVEGIKFDMRGLLFSGILIGAVGAIMDVAMSVASAISEIKKANPSMQPLQLVTAGMNVGRDIMGTMANTLILAYTGGALPFMLLFMAYHMEPIRVMNWELIVTEIVRALVGSIGLIISVPITSLVAGWLAGHASRGKKQEIV